MKRGKTVNDLILKPTTMRYQRLAGVEAELKHPAMFGNMFGGGGDFGAGGGGFGGESTAPADTRPPEERYEEQLRQLNDMGFYEFDRNVQALRRSGGSVQGAVEYLLTNP